VFGHGQTAPGYYTKTLPHGFIRISVVSFTIDKPKRYYRNAFLLPSVGLNPSPLTSFNGEGFKRKRYYSAFSALARATDPVTGEPAVR
jgi:hypothetical protein